MEAGRCRASGPGSNVGSMPAAYTPTTAPHRDSPVVTAMKWAMHALFALLLLIGTIRGAQESTHPAWLDTGCVLLGAWYLIGLFLQGRPRAFGIAWFCVLFAGWVALVQMSAELSWVAFALFFLALHLLPRPFGLLAVALGTAVVVVAQLRRPDVATVPSVLGPCMGAIVAVGMSWLYRQLREESEQRRALNAELVAAQGDLIATHDALSGAQREAGRLEERTRVARDIHDTLAQGFSSIVLLSRAGLSAGDRADADRLRDILTRIEQTAADGLADARTVVHALTPPELDQAPLVAALRRLAERQADPQVEFVTEGEITSLPTTTEVALLRIAQGALANVRQHAGAARAVLTLATDADAVQLDVHDDGAGFDPSGPIVPSQRGGYGIAAMRARTEEAGGHFDIESEPGSGTTVHARIPLPRGTIR